MALCPPEAVAPTEAAGATLADPVDSPGALAVPGDWVLVGLCKLDVAGATVCVGPTEAEFDVAGADALSPTVDGAELVASDVKGAALVAVAPDGLSPVDVALVAVPVDCACAAAALAASEDSNAAASGAWMLAAALAAEPRPASRKKMDVGPGMTIPNPVARCSIRCGSDSEEMLARRSSLRL